jgi:hypothetical protein
MELFLIDAIGPFFVGHPKRRINWSKIPFSRLATEGEARRVQFDAIRCGIEEFAERVSSIGYNAVTLDDLPHLTDHPWYEPEVRKRIRVFSEEFTKIFEIMKRNGLQIYITVDILSTTPALKQRIASDPDAATAFLVDLIERFFRQYPQVSGLVVRIGECDGLDVKGDFKSELHIKTARALNRLLRELLPVFEAHDRRLILRTWTVGAHRVGDLMWHRATFAAALNGIDSPALVLSMKYGESDFFRYLPLNSNFFRTPLPKIIELQARREYEGAGEYPSFIGWDYESFERDLREAPNMLGISVWCQTGGWLPFRRLAFVGEGSPWTELNAKITLRLFRDRCSVEGALEDMVDGGVLPRYIEFLRLCDEVIKEVLYVEDFASQKLFFRRVRVPTLVGVYWNNIFINHSTRKLLRHFVADPEASVQQAHGGLGKLERMEAIAEDLGLPVDDITYMRRTFEILVLARSYYLRPYDEKIRKRLKKAKKAYKAAYPHGSRFRYKVKLDFKPFRVRRRFLGWVFALLLRRRRGYRLVDHLFSLHLLSMIYRLLRRRKPKLVPKFARKTAMGIDTVFR